MTEGDPLGTNRDMVVEQWVKEGDSLGTKRDMVVEQCVDGRRPAGDQERHGDGGMW